MRNPTPQRKIRLLRRGRFPSAPRRTPDPKFRWIALGIFVLAALPKTILPQGQNPSPMVENTRTHQRRPEHSPAGQRSTLTTPLPRPVALFLPEKAAGAAAPRLLLHFHGAPFVAEQAVANASVPYALAVVNLGNGSAVYERAFPERQRIFDLLAAVEKEVRALSPRFRQFSQIYLSAFSAGYGAVRAILRDCAAVAKIHGVLLLDGLHTDYLPPGTVLAEGGRLNEQKLRPFLNFARRAASGKKNFAITHSEIFPGTYASTTETTDYLIRALGLARTPVLKWGPMGMQQLSEARQNDFVVWGFAGNSAPDHVDHYHALPDLLKVFDRQK